MGNVNSRLLCAQLCLLETEFVCRSALFNFTNKECTLAEMNRNTIDTTHSDRIESAAIRNQRVQFIQVAQNQDQIYYIENMCIEGIVCAKYSFQINNLLECLIFWHRTEEIL